MGYISRLETIQEEHDGVRRLPRAVGADNTSRERHARVYREATLGLFC